MRDLIKRFQIDYVDGKIVSVTDELKHDTLNILRMVSLLNKQQEEINLLQDRIDELEDDNEKYSLGCEDIILENPQFKVTSCPTEIKDTSNNHYYWLEHEGNVKALCQVINEVINERNVLKQQITNKNNKLVKDTANKISEHQKRILDLIDDKIREVVKEYKDNTISFELSKFAHDKLYELKRELQE